MISQFLTALSLPEAAHNVLAYAAFAFYVVLIIAGGLGAALSRILVRALVGLAVTFLGVAGLYLLLASPFLAFMQLLIYVGAICVLIFFAIMLVKNTGSGEEMRLPGLGQTAGALIAALAPLALFGPLIVLHAGGTAGLPAVTPLKEIGNGLLSYYVLPFELISIVLLVAMAGGIFLAWDKRFRK
jgi:NADH-quinone oxidoreductase subunit J